MKIKLTAILFMIATVSILAQTNTPPSVPGIPTPSGGTSLLLAIIPLAVPLILAVIKFLTDKLPAWTLPILAACLGELLNYVSGLAGGPSTTAINGVLLGSAGVGLREILDQLKQKMSAPPKV